MVAKSPHSLPYVQAPAWLGGLVTEGREQKTKIFKSVTLLQIIIHQYYKITNLEGFSTKFAH